MPRSRAAPVDSTVCAPVMIGENTGSFESVMEGCSGVSVDSDPTSCARRAVIVVRSASVASPSISDEEVTSA